MDDRIVRFIAALRGAGVRISLAESQDAAAATQQIGVVQRQRFKNALKTTLVKAHADFPAFDELFRLYFGVDEPPPGRADEKLDRAGLEQLEQALRSMAAELRHMLERLAEGQPFSQDELERAAEQAGLEWMRGLGDRHRLSRRMMRQLGLTEAFREIEELLWTLAQLGMGAEALERMRQVMGQNFTALKEQVDRFAGISLAERQSKAEIRPMRPVSLLDRPFQSLTPGEADQLRTEVNRLAARLRTRAALRQKRGKGRRLDAKATIRSNLRFGSVPFALVHKTKRQKARFTLICDVSTSMRPVVTFLLILMYQIQAQVGRTRSFAFIDHIEEVTGDFEAQRPERAVPLVLRRIPPGHYNTDLGRSLDQFVSRDLSAVDRRTTLIFCGDGRNNFNDPRTDLVERLCRRARKVVWFNPESPRKWGTGDSDMLQYLPMVDAVFQVSNLRQLSDAIDALIL